MSQTVNEGEEAYADDTPLVELFGDGARARLLSVFATKRNREFTVSELARQAGITRKTVYEYLDEFESLGIVESIEAGQGSRYTTADSEIATKLYELNGVTLQKLLDIEE
ncbi:helix-turn-helix domain-containing protein [Halopiger goleimassiliensis]|uniref:helix-turn-helix domain-containing protein n=1 Tax=Halopiger goleimassiliensis TaxID=1293048 RepID=UPI0009DBD354|nr:helix-turn-helix domain-containing protein [Halopiger goleimassiliensis]